VKHTPRQRPGGRTADQPHSGQDQSRARRQTRRRGHPRPPHRRTRPGPVPGERGRGRSRRVPVRVRTRGERTGRLRPSGPLTRTVPGTGRRRGRGRSLHPDIDDIDEIDRQTMAWLAKIGLACGDVEQERARRGCCGTTFAHMLPGASWPRAFWPPRCAPTSPTWTTRSLSRISAATRTRCRWRGTCRVPTRLSWTPRRSRPARIAWSPPRGTCVAACTRWQRQARSFACSERYSNCIWGSRPKPSTTSTRRRPRWMNFSVSARPRVALLSSRCITPPERFSGSTSCSPVPVLAARVGARRSVGGTVAVVRGVVVGTG
jgi:hypothetical protein